MKILLTRIFKICLLISIVSIWTITYVGACGKEIFNHKLITENNRCVIETKNGSFCVQFVNLPNENRSATEKACYDFYGIDSLSSTYSKNDECSHIDTTGICSGLPKEIYAGSDSLLIYYYHDYKNAMNHCNDKFHGSWIKATENQITRKKDSKKPSTVN